MSLGWWRSLNGTNWCECIIKLFLWFWIVVVKFWGCLPIYRALKRSEFHVFIVFFEKYMFFLLKLVSTSQKSVAAKRTGKVSKETPYSDQMRRPNVPIRDGLGIELVYSLNPFLNIVFSTTYDGDFTISKEEAFGIYHIDISQNSTRHFRATVENYEKNGDYIFVQLFKKKTNGEFTLVKKKSTSRRRSLKSYLLRENHFCHPRCQEQF